MAANVSAPESTIPGWGSTIPGAVVPNKVLETVQGKGEAVSLPSVGRSNGVVLWDELPTRKGAGSENLQMGALNVQTNSMLSNR
ncbi:hypothetical protein [Acidithiobacillus sp. AMEEHan]|uniref:hypothetical protein n=1 Tax=Acidithiobacillus sp. AMEEHan TaxID=2994951 RepID=UPI0027E44555|nr:hypothetical protein [Acidithiobacillus sp. AMEEHan]